MKNCFKISLLFIFLSIVFACNQPPRSDFQQLQQTNDSLTQLSDSLILRIQSLEKEIPDGIVRVSNAKVSKNPALTCQSLSNYVKKCDAGGVKDYTFQFDIINETSATCTLSFAKVEVLIPGSLNVYENKNPGTESILEELDGGGKGIAQIERTFSFVDNHTFAQGNSIRFVLKINGEEITRTLQIRE